jgi:hypothetical protein
MTPTAASFTALLLALAAGPTFAQGDADVLRCLDVADNTARLQCFDQAATALRTARAAGKSVEIDMTPRDSNFGQLGPAPDTLASRITGRFDGWNKLDRVKLANGQVWQLLDEGTSIGARTDPQVLIKAGALKASYFMTIEGLGAPVRVKRVQ